MRTWLLAGLLVVSGPAFAGPDGLEQAIRAGDTVAVTLSLSDGIPVDAALPDGMLTPLALAAALGDGAMVGTLLASGASPDAATGLGLTPLVAAANSCHSGADVIAILLTKGADPNLRAPGGMSPLLVAGQKGRGAMAKVLLAAGADAAAVDVFGDGLLNYAIYAQSPVEVQAALAAGSGTEQLDQLFLTRGYRAAVWPGLQRCNDAP